MSENFGTSLPDRFIRNTIALHGEAGEVWLGQLPEVISGLSAKWKITSTQVCPNLSFNFVALCMLQNNLPAVLKIGFPEPDSPLAMEYKALIEFNGDGAVNALEFNTEFNALLIERAIPGRELNEVCGDDHQKAADIAIDVIKRLIRRPTNNDNFPRLEQWTNGLTRAADTDFNGAKANTAFGFFQSLTIPEDKRFILHGDLHYGNILSAERMPFLAIDPKGVIGESGYEIGVFLNDQAGWLAHLPNRSELLNDSVDRFSAAFDIDARNLRQWAFAQAVLAGWWMFEDFGRDWEKYLLLSDMWSDLGV